EDLVRIHSAMQELDGYTIVKLVVVAFCKPDTSHSARGDLPREAIGSDAMVNRHNARSLVLGQRRLPGRMMEELGGTRIVGQKLCDLIAQFHIAAASLIEESGSRSRPNDRGGFEEFVDSMPAFGRHDRSAGRRLTPWKPHRAAKRVRSASLVQQSKVTH